MSEVDFRNEVDLLVSEAVDEYTLRAVSELDESTLNDEDAFHEAMLEIEASLNGDMRDIIREAEEEVRARIVTVA